MKWLLIACLIVFAAWLTLSNKKTAALSPIKTGQALNDSIDFTAQVLPILVKHCSPCHFTGGKMYSRLPFDHDTTILNHSEGILRRIKTGDDNLILKSFIEQRKK
jgi:hypothetical protein